MRHMIVTGCDAAHFDLATDLIASIRANCDEKFKIGFVRFCTTAVPKAIANLVDQIVDCSSEYGQFDPQYGYYAAYANIKPSLPKLFREIDLLTWVDADCWVQNDVTFRKVEIASATSDICIHPMLDVHYLTFPMPSDRTVNLYARAAPRQFDESKIRQPMMNAGVFSARPASPIWAAWRSAQKDLRKRFLNGENIYFSDEIPLNYLLQTSNVRIFPLRGTDNWQTYACQPRFDVDALRLVVPTFPFEPISIIHLAGNSKDHMFDLGVGKKVKLRYREFQKIKQDMQKMRLE